MLAGSSLRRLAWRAQAGPWVVVIRLAAVLVMALGVAASAWIARGWEATVSHQREERLDRGAASRTTAIRDALGQYENVLRAERSLWLASARVSRGDFRRFADTLDLPQRYQGLQSLGWRSFVPRERLARFLARARADGTPDFDVHPPGSRPNYYVTLYNEPARLFRSTWGSDARATPSVLAAMEQARTSGQVTMSGQTTLAPDLARPPAQRPVAFELFVPVYENGAKLDTVAQRRARFLGWAYGAFRAQGFLEDALRSVQQSTGVELRDPAAGTGGPAAASPPASAPAARTCGPTP
jgi:CHASE1-domain containing sensor protein